MTRSRKNGCSYCCQVFYWNERISNTFSCNSEIQLTKHRYFSILFCRPIKFSIRRWFYYHVERTLFSVDFLLSSCTILSENRPLFGKSNGSIVSEFIRNSIFSISVQLFLLFLLRQKHLVFSVSIASFFHLLFISSFFSRFDYICIMKSIRNHHLKCREMQYAANVVIMAKPSSKRHHCCCTFAVSFSLDAISPIAYVCTPMIFSTR